ncbi:50S ribosomal protein L29 [Candidatus Woesearchaeota archaeon]|nr:50S ribosomal protein L29 [Candidatus Woesearchaeota archaeon]
MKAKELRLMNESDMGNRIIDLKKELMKINSQIAIGMSPKNPSKTSEIKKTIAKIMTIKREKAKQKTDVSKRNE